MNGISGPYWLAVQASDRYEETASQEAPMFSHQSIEDLARARQTEALAAARSERLLNPREDLDPAWEQFNHYHYWPKAYDYTRLESELAAERAQRIARRGPGLLRRLAWAARRLLGRPAASVERS